jgi:hypothetical protein
MRDLNSRPLPCERSDPRTRANLSGRRRKSFQRSGRRRTPTNVSVRCFYVLSRWSSGCSRRCQTRRAMKRLSSLGQVGCVASCSARCRDGS